jgi:thiamine pyrophosphokinase
MSQVVVVIGGGPLWHQLPAEVEADALVIAADSGLDHAVAAGLAPSVLIGDLDSISAHGKMWAYAHHVEIDEHPVDKDATDTELALRRAAALASTTGRTELLVLGSHGERFDHSLGTLVALGNPELAAFGSIRMLLDGVEVRVVHAGRAITVPLVVGTQFSLLALHGECRGIDVSGAQWPLVGATFAASTTRGLSNLALGPLHVAVGDGVLTLVVP